MAAHDDPAARRSFAAGQPRLVRWGIAAWSAIGILILAYVVFRYVLYPVRSIFPPILVALVIVYLLNPVVGLLERRHVPRAVAVLATYVVFLGIFGFLLRLLIPHLASQVSAFVRALPALLSRAQDWATGVAHRLNVNADLAQAVRDLGPGGGANEFLSRIFSVTVGAVRVVFVVVLGIVLSVYLLIDLPKIRRGAMALIPPRHQGATGEMLERMGHALGGYFRGQLLVALFVGLASMAGLFVVGLPYWALVGAIAGVTNLIPLIGPFIGAVPAVFIAFTTEGSGGLLHLDPGWPLAIGAAVALLVVQQIDNHVISPNVMRRTVRLHPITVMLGLAAGGTVLGLWGMLLAVPVIASGKVVLLHVWDRSSRWPPPEGDGARNPSKPAQDPTAADDIAAPERPSAPPVRIPERRRPHLS